MNELSLDLLRAHRPRDRLPRRGARAAPDSPFETHAVFCPVAASSSTRSARPSRGCEVYPPSRRRPRSGGDHRGVPDATREGLQVPPRRARWCFQREAVAQRRRSSRSKVRLPNAGTGVHACRVDDLPSARRRAWEIELDGDLVEGRLKLSRRRGRLVRPIDSWNDRPHRGNSRCGAWSRRLHAADEPRDAGLEDPGLTGLLPTRSRPWPSPPWTPHGPSEPRLPSGSPSTWRTPLLDARAPTECVASSPPTPPTRGAAARDQDAFAAERALQASWLTDRLGLTAQTG